MSVWGRRQSRRVPAAINSIYVDDCSTVAFAVAQVRTSLLETEKFDHASGQRVHPSKTKGM
eukprot:11870338-Alexandrium_andersonii.AAC.1